MKVSELRWLFVAVVAALLFMSFRGEPMHLGVSAEWTNGRYRFAGGTTTGALALAGLIIGLYLLLMYAPPARLGQPLPGVFRRLVAFWLDFILAMAAVAPILGVLPALTEWRRTGVFEWNFERTNPAPGDGLLATIGVVLCFAALVFYYALPLIRGRPSPGACIAGYQIVPENGTTLSLRTAVLRTLLGFFAVCSFYLAPFIARDRKNGKFWLDKVFGTRAVRLK
jgi:uncharacterized RDD family membrane protein YckC